MLYSEFTKLVGFEVDVRYYNDVVEHEYYESHLDKQEWCKQWKKNGGIQKAYEWMKNKSSEHMKEIGELNHTIELLRSKEEAYRSAYVQKCKEYNDRTAQWETAKENAFEAKRIIEEMKASRKDLVEFMIDRSEAMGDPELRLRCINMVGPKEYIRYKMEQGYNLWELDKELILNNMK